MTLMGAARRHIAEPLLADPNKLVVQRVADYGSFLHTGIQHEHAPSIALIHQYVYVGRILPVSNELLGGGGEDACNEALRGACRSVLGAVAWTGLTHADLVVYVQVLQRRAHAPGIKDCTRLSLVIRHVERHECGFESIPLRHPLRLVGFTDAAFTAQFGEPSGLALLGLTAALLEDDCTSEPMSSNGKATLVDFTVWRQYGQRVQHSAQSRMG